MQRLLECLLRVDTGVVQFGDDWPGMFFRGDEAIGKASELRLLAAHIRAGMTGVDVPKYLDRLADEFESCSIDKIGKVPRAQQPVGHTTVRSP
jgi:hypothetical protein